MSYSREMIALIMLSIALFLLACKVSKVETKTDMNETKSLESLWEKVDSLEDIGLPQSALLVAQEIKERARENHSDDHLVKAIIVENKFQSELEEDGLEKAITRLQSEVELSSLPAKAILSSYLGELYQRYIEQNQWKLRGRISDGLVATDLEKMTLAEMVEMSDKCYLNSIDQKDVLMGDLADYQILLEGKTFTNAEGGTTTIFDVLVDRVLDHFEHGGILDQRQPQSLFMVNRADYFAERSTFVNLPIVTSDSTNRNYLTLVVFQDVLDETNVMRDLRRLQFVHRNSTLIDKNTLYVESLNVLINNNKDSYYVAELYFHLASFYYGSFADSRKAFEICNQTISNYKSSRGAAQCTQLLQEIERIQLDLQIEKVVIPGQEILAKIGFRNLTKLSGRVILLTLSQSEAFESLAHEEKVPYLLQQEVVEEMTIELPRTEDYRLHSREILIRPMKMGQYLLVLSSGPNFQLGADAISAASFQVSNLSYVQDQFFGSARMNVKDRTTGQAKSGVKVTWFSHSYDRRLRRQIKSVALESTSDSAGYVPVPQDTRSSFTALLSGEDDSLYLKDQYLSQYQMNQDVSVQSEVRFFTDRSIYRPGQIVYFKGLLLKREGNDSPKIQANKRLLITLYNTNGQVVSNIEKVTNGFGSFEGSVPLPKDGLVGQMSLGNNLSSDRTYVQVEAYKRPSFEIIFDTINGTFKLEDEVSVSGSVKSYAGAALGQVDLTYKVIRKARFPYYFYSRRFPGPSSPEREIATGVIKTESKGEFSFTFPAIADEAIDPSLEPVFQFEVSIFATDISGESQSGSTTLSAGYRPFGLKLLSEEVVDLSKEKKLIFESKNSQGDAIPITGDVKIIQLPGPSQWFRQRYWEVPDLLDAAQRTAWYDMPGTADLNILREWGSVPFSNMGQTQEIDISHLHLPAGYYELVSTSKASGGIVYESRFQIQLVNPLESFVPREKLISVLGEGKDFRPGEVATLQIGSPMPAIVHYLVERKEMYDQDTIKTTGNGWKTIEVPITEDDRGDIYIHLWTVYQNRMQHEVVKISVPWIDKNLSISLTSFRNLVLPGSKERISLEVLDNEGVGAEAEILIDIYDASLDAIKAHDWKRGFFPYRGANWQFLPAGFGSSYAMTLSNGWLGIQIEVPEQFTPSLNWFDFPIYGGYRAMSDHVLRSSKMPAAPPAAEMMQSAGEESLQEETQDIPAIRENFNETLIFYPSLMTGEDGKLSFEYTMNDALTKWRMMIFGHRKDLSSGYVEAPIVSQKQLMVTVNRPRFLRAGDEIYFGGKLDNLTDSILLGTAHLELRELLTGASLSHFGLGPLELDITIPAHASIPIFWKIQIPKDFRTPIEYTLSATGNSHNDAERAIVPVLENRTLVTETRAIHLRKDSSLNIDLAKLTNLSSTTAEPERLLIDITANPTWYAIKALPFLIDYPYECSEQVFNRLYANSLGMRIVKENPQIKKVFEQWSSADISSNLSRNEWVKSASLEETPWVADAISEEEQTRRLANYFDENTLRDRQLEAIRALASRQSDGGGFPWFPGGRDHRYITQYITEGLVRMVSWIDPSVKAEVDAIINKAIQYLDQEMADHYTRLQKQVEAKKAIWEDDHLEPIVIQFLYLRKLSSLPSAGITEQAYGYYYDQAVKFWPKKSLQNQALLAQIFQMTGETGSYQQLINSLKERVLRRADLGAFWKYDNGFRWWELPIETHSRLIEVFVKNGDEMLVEELRMWLLNNKRTNRWSTTKATSDAIRALLSGSSNWLAPAKAIEVDFGATDYAPVSTEEAGSLYTKYDLTPAEILKTSNLEVSNSNNQPAWISVFFQYFEDLDKIEASREAGSPLSISKEVFLEEITKTGIVNTPLGGQNLDQGDVLVVQFHLTADRDMEFVHLQDRRSAGVEPSDILSGYRWQGGLGFYQSNSDLAINFFIDYLPKGTYVIQYRLQVSQKGNFSGGYATIQSMYAPEFAAHSKGVRLISEDNN